MRIVMLGEVADINPRAERFPAETQVSFVGMAQLDATSALATPLSDRQYSDVANGYTKFRDGDILAAKITPCWENGKVGVARLGHEIGAGSTEFHVIRPREDIHDRYLLHFLRQGRIRSLGELRMTGSGGQRRVPAKFLANLEVPLPSLAEQSRIAAILDQADAIRAKRRQVLTQLDYLRAAVTGEILGGREWTSTLADLAEVQIGPFGSLLHKSDYIQGGVPVINPMHIKDGTLVADNKFSVTEDKARELSLYRLRPGDVVMGRRGEMGRAGVVREEHAGFVCGTGSLILRSHSAAGELLHAVVTSPRMRSHMERSALGATLPNLNGSIVSNAPAPELDPELSNHFDKVSGALRNLRESSLLSSRSTDELFALLQTRAFKGEL